ncbi:flagellin [Sediminicoccus rosea]|jgi:flagellar hook-associated protein 3 FlgL|uniref:Flagellin n=1 Tax=Sediminicoccus rosea TaxID=1225128 RepID=A0ABZ0PHP5_9PROT|nr:flagellin [Sediminicoccus rosea]WPB85186.1 flagellin [Sediminicoccus rosea]
MSSIELFNRLASETMQLRGRVETLTRQSTSGLKADRLGDLGPEVPRAVSLRGELGRRELYGQVMEQALGRTAVMQDSLDRLTEIARDFRTKAATRITAGDPGSLMTVQSDARAALVEVAHLLNTRHAGEYLFGGSDLTQPPIPDPEGLATGQMAQDIAAEVAALPLQGTAATIAATRAIAQSNAPGVTPFSDRLAADALLPPEAQEARRGVPAADGQMIGYGIIAGRNADAVSRGETTGSWARDLMRNLMSLAALAPEQMSDRPAFDAFMGSLRDGLSSAELALGEEAGALGTVEARMEATQRRHDDLSTALSRQLSDIEEVDVADVLVRLQATRNALEASYRALGSMRELTLANFLR